MDRYRSWCVPLGSSLVLCLSQPVLASPVALPAPIAALLKAAPIAAPTSSLSPDQRGLTVPSLWWAVAQFGSGTVEQWLAYPLSPQGGRVDLIVRSDQWGRFGYFDRYAFVNHLGTAASDFGYNLLVFDRRQNLLAAYTCNFAQVTPTFISGTRDAQGNPIPDFVRDRSSPALRCEVWLNPNFPITAL